MEDTMVEERAMATSKTFKVDVYAKPAKPGDPPENVQFSLSSPLKTGPKGELVFNKTKDDMYKQDYYLLEFDLHDTSTLGLTFAPNPMVALWVNLGSTVCPTSKCYSDEVYAVCVNKSGDQLTVRNEDKTIADFSFSLGFLKAGADPLDPNSYIRYDPVGTNQDGGK
jgi:hypothetical protein